MISRRDSRRVSDPCLLNTTLPVLLFHINFVHTPLAIGSDTETAVSIAESNGQADLGTALAQRGDRKTTRQQLIGNLEEATMYATPKEIKEMVSVPYTMQCI